MSIWFWGLQDRKGFRWIVRKQGWMRGVNEDVLFPGAALGGAEQPHRDLKLGNPERQMLRIKDPHLLLNSF